MKINLDKTINYLFLLGLFFFGFNQVEVMPFMGEYVREFGSIFFFIGFFFMGIEVLKTGRINLPYKNNLYILILVFYIITICCSIVNIPSIIENYFKRTTGISRFIRQMISLTIPIFIFLPFFFRAIQNWDNRRIFFTIRKVFTLSLVFVTFYCFWELLFSYFGFYPAKYILEIYGLFPFMDPILYTTGRISGITYEPPFFAIYLITISGFIFSYILTEKNIIYKFTPSIVLLMWTFFSGSRTGLLVIFFIFFLFMVFLYKQNFYRKQIHYTLIFSVLALSLIILSNPEKLKDSVLEKIESLDFAGNLKTSVSNKTRFGMQYASLQVFKENAIFGVGFGQQAYHSQHHYPRWATVNNWEFDQFYKNKKELSFPPGYNIFTRLLAELGIIGFTIWVTILLYSIRLAYKIYKNSDDEITRVLLVSISISLIGLYINWLQTDTFRMYGVWIFFAILMKLDYQQKNKYNEQQLINNSSL
ncbi:O-antigen ligase family protein [Faecalibacter rhinopitheci]|uniref:O-antigen ligase family protein n=1 Tax=Faecalibacter rhinopitheci TaxID=2779678 RepID=A0A8J7KAM3_9FLAO|nr:O-antigen ligase family protein [Faecalibacter rhinopitheci]MBF0597700.1 O-antigen ligase family protein [Faecalibacter rhinopitheci]